MGQSVSSAQDRDRRQSGGESNEEKDLLEWTTEEADEMTELSNVSVMPVDQEGFVR